MWGVLIIAVFLIGIYIITFLAQRAGVKTSTDYLLAGRSLGWLATFAGLFMSMMSSFTFVGMPGLTYNVGVGAWALGLVTASQAGTIIFFYRKLRELGSKYEYVSQADYFCDRFTNAKSFRLLIAILGVVAVILGHFVSQLIGAGLALQQLTGYQLPYFFGITFFVIVTVGFVYIGGFRATAWTDILMGAIMLVCAMGVAAVIMNKLGMGLPDIYRELAAREPELMSLPGKTPAFPYPQIVSWVIGYTFAFMLLPHMVIRAYGAASDTAIRATALGWTTVGCFAHFLTAPVIGLSAVLLLPTLPEGVAPDAIVPYIANTFAPLPQIVGPLLLMGLFAAALSTSAGALLVLSNIITKDILVEVFNIKLSDVQMRQVSRLIVIILGILAIILAYAPQHMIATIMTASLGLVSVFVIPYAFGLYWKRFNTQGAISGIIVGLVILIWLTYIPILGGGAGQAGISFLKFQPLVWTILIQLIVSVAVTLITPPPPQEVIEKHFS